MPAPVSEGVSCFRRLPRGWVSIPLFGGEGVGFDPHFSGAKRLKKGFGGAEGAALEKISQISKKLIRKNAIKSDFSKKNRGSFSFSKICLVKSAKNT